MPDSIKDNSLILNIKNECLDFLGVCIPKSICRKDVEYQCSLNYVLFSICFVVDLM